MSMDSLRNLLASRAGKFNLARQIEVSFILEKFNELVLQEFGSIAKGRAQAIYLKDGVICVAILSSPLAQEIKFREEKIINGLNGYFEQEVVRTIRYMV